MCLAHIWCPASMCFLRSPRSCLQERGAGLGGVSLHRLGQQALRGGPGSHLEARLRGSGRVKMEPGQGQGDSKE